MPSRDVFLLMRNLDTVLRRKAYYTATAYHCPEKLGKEEARCPPAPKEDYASNRRKLAQMMGLR